MEILLINLQTYPNFFKYYIISENEELMDYPCFENFCYNFMLIEVENSTENFVLLVTFFLFSFIFQTIFFYYRTDKS